MEFREPIDRLKFPAFGVAAVAVVIAFSQPHSGSNLHGRSRIEAAEAQRPLERKGYSKQDISSFNALLKRTNRFEKCLKDNIFTEKKALMREYPDAPQGSPLIRVSWKEVKFMAETCSD